jgi:hypothetical protein
MGSAAPPDRKRLSVPDLVVIPELADYRSFSATSRDLSSLLRSLSHVMFAAGMGERCAAAAGFAQ